MILVDDTYGWVTICIFFFALVVAITLKRDLDVQLK